MVETPHPWGAAPPKEAAEGVGSGVLLTAVRAVQAELEHTILRSALAEHPVPLVEVIEDRATSVQVCGPEAGSYDNTEIISFEIHALFHE